MAAWAACLLCAIVVLKPQEFVAPLSGVPLMHIAFGAVLLFLVVDIVGRSIRPSLAPQIPLAVAFFGWGLLTTAIKQPGSVGTAVSFLFTPVVLFGAVAIGASSANGVRAVSATFAACALFVTVVAIRQADAPFECAVAEPDDWMGSGELVPDGRGCETSLDCRENAPDPEANYRCERPGPFNTTTIAGRVRYRGEIGDPNELSLTIALATPFILPMNGRKPRKASNLSEPGRGSPSLSGLRRLGARLRLLVAGAMTAAMGFVVVITRSRSGVIAFLIALGLAAIRAAGAWGVAIGCLVGPLMIASGGRSGAEAEASAEERMDILRDGLGMIQSTKGIGVGLGAFSDECSIGLTAHNTYLLAAAEAGIVGLFLFGLLLYVSLKVPIAIGFGRYAVDELTIRLSLAIAISLCCALAGIFFLSWAYEGILFILLGASAALYSAARAQDPRVIVRLSGREVALVCGAMLGVLGFIYGMTRLGG